MENTVAYEKELEVLKSRKEEFAKIDTKLNEMNKMNDLLDEMDPHIAKENATTVPQGYHESAARVHWEVFLMHGFSYALLL